VIPRRPLALAALLTFSVTTGVAGEARDPQAARNATARSKAARPRFQEYRVAAGTTLPIELRTQLSSNTSREADAIEGRLLRPLTTPEGIELVPAGSTLLGTVSEADPAGQRMRGRLAFAFQVIEHPETGSRAMIKTSVLTFESAIPEKGTLFTEVRRDKGSDASVLLLAPLLVKLPVN
jgi:hypothetical protein